MQNPPPAIEPIITPPATPTPDVVAGQEDAAINALQKRVDALEQAMAQVESQFNQSNSIAPNFFDIIAAHQAQFLSSCAVLQHFGVVPPSIPTWPAEVPAPAGYTIVNGVPTPIPPAA